MLDFSKDVSTRQIIDKLDASDYFNVNKILYDNNEIEETLRKSSSDLIIVFEAGFDNNLRHTGKARVQLIADATDPNNATILTSYASNIIADYQQSRIMQQQSPIQIIPPNKVIVQSGYAKCLQFCAGSNGIDFNVDMRHDDFHLYCPRKRNRYDGSIAGISRTSAMDDYSQNGTLLCAVMRQSGYNSVAVCLCITCSGSRQSFFRWLCSHGSSSSSISAVGIIGFHYRPYPSGSHAVFGMVLMMPTVLLSGMIFPIENMPLPLQLISNVIPARWYIVGIKKIMIEGLGISYAQREMGILMLMAVVLLIISLKKV